LAGHFNWIRKSIRAAVIAVANKCGRKPLMKFAEKIREAGATGYILLWLLGIPIPILLLIFLLRGCT
jgi:hypothetical protein